MKTNVANARKHECKSSAPPRVGETKAMDDKMSKVKKNESGIRGTGPEPELTAPPPLLVYTTQFIFYPPFTLVLLGVCLCDCVYEALGEGGKHVPKELTGA